MRLPGSVQTEVEEADDDDDDNDVGDCLPIPNRA
jgi:hypothetical protein